MAKQHDRQLPPPAETPPHLASKPPDIRFLDGLRGLAALFVLIHHASYLLHRGIFVQVQSFGRVTPAASHRALYRCVSLLLDPFRYGHVAVVFFFVLSGFVIHLRYARELRRDGCDAQFKWPQFVWRRFRRLYPPLLLALALTSALFAVGSRVSPTIYQGQTLYGWVNVTVAPNTHWFTLLGNLTFLMPFVTTWWSGNGPLWSLGYEWWFYMLYPAFWWLSKKNLWVATAVMIGFFVLSLFPSAWPSEMACRVLGMMLTWWLGVLLAEVYAGRIRLHFAWLVPLLLLLGAFGVRSFPEQVKTAIVGLGFTGLLAACFWLHAAGFRLRALSALKPLGDMSYTLYVIHMPVLVFVSAVLIFRSPQSVLPDSPWILLLGVSLAIVLAWAAHWVVEVPFTRVPSRPRLAEPGIVGIPVP